MSNWARAKVNFKDVDKEIFEEALKNMGYSIDYEDHSVKGAYSMDGSRECDCALYDIESGEPANIGLTFEHGEDDEVIVNVVGDWYNKTYNDKTFTQALRLEYTTANMTSVAAKNGYVVEQTEMLEKYKRRIVYVKAA